MWIFSCWHPLLSNSNCKALWFLRCTDWYFNHGQINSPPPDRVFLLMNGLSFSRITSPGTTNWIVPFTERFFRPIESTTCFCVLWDFVISYPRKRTRLSDRLVIFVFSPAQFKMKFLLHENLQFFPWFHSLLPCCRWYRPQNRPHSAHILHADSFYP